MREAVAADGDAVGALTEQVYAAGGWGDPSYMRRLRDGRSRIEQAHVLVACRDDAIVGSVTIARPGTPFAAISGSDELEVRMLVVAESARGKGVGGLLMDGCEELARREGFAAVVLLTEPDMHAAHRLYERRGYTRVPERDRDIGRFSLLAYRLEL